ncbi:helix-turn-helix transcriptional regulator [Mumia sp. ZJ430]|uniref:helix-turn-helix transcriptional regulator n=1 Tax=Mumia sp. ZJ430 TaxID=2708083 RepID=UPI00141E28D8|nr:helix-turn-helix transcriptional regulator [Mumia sp. ZJ430]
MTEEALDPAIARALAAVLRSLRAESGLSQEDVAHAAGITRNHYQLLESGLSDRAKGSPANPRLSTLLDLSRVFGTPLTQLVEAVVTDQSLTHRQGT